MSKVFKSLIAAAAASTLLFASACTTRNAETPEDTAAPATSAAAGDETTAAGGEEGAEFTVAFVPKIQGIPYFEAMNTGGKAAEADIPGLTWEYQGPTTADPAAQADIVRSMIQKKVDVLIVAPNDPDSLAPILQEAKDAGIKVGTSDTDAPNSVREVFVEQATGQGIGEYTADTLAAAMGEAGKAVIVSCGETAENLNSWIKIEEETFKTKYPEIELLPTVYAGEDQNRAAQMATDLMNANPDLKGIIGQCTTSAPGVAQAVRDAGKIGEVFTVGVGTPQAMLPYLEDGSSSGSILWDVENLGYLTAWAGAQLFQGKPFEAVNQVSDDIKDVEFREDTKELILGPPLVLTKDNAGQFDY
ncbi:autoinducer 2 ABC transporter substrate-binding protein [Tessaracoccus lubricantis]|uniref:Autoinducer 2 ABC transporter substrate-binding protein n=1 Tax=Tessaracoccus lubricantis TaxID=545543 RepID=A0ABP9FGK1_9ACTN